jgi:uncharacterized membrane protein (UPF0182 family)
VVAHPNRDAGLSVFEIPNWTVRLVVLLLVIGFPIALILAWAFELTPEGLKRTEAADAAPTQHSAHRALIYVIIVAAALSVCLFFVGRYTGLKRSESTGSAAKSDRSSSVRQYEQRQGERLLR